MKNRFVFAPFLFCAEACGHRLRDNLAIFSFYRAVTLGAATYAAMTKAPFFGSDPTTVTILLAFDLAILVLLGTLVLQRIYAIWAKRRRNQAASRLHVRVVSVFTMLAAAPAVLVAMFAAVFFYYGVEAWFFRARQHRSGGIARSRASVFEGASASLCGPMRFPWRTILNREAVRLSEDPVRFAQAVSAQAYLRSIDRSDRF